MQMQREELCYPWKLDKMKVCDAPLRCTPVELISHHRGNGDGGGDGVDDGAEGVHPNDQHILL